MTCGTKTRTTVTKTKNTVTKQQNKQTKKQTNKEIYNQTKKETNKEKKKETNIHTHLKKLPTARLAQDAAHVRCVQGLVEENTRLGAVVGATLLQELLSERAWEVPAECPEDISKYMMEPTKAMYKPRGVLFGGKG